VGQLTVVLTQPLGEIGQLRHPLAPEIENYSAAIFEAEDFAEVLPQIAANSQFTLPNGPLSHV
jgi:hypothetical protein